MNKLERFKNVLIPINDILYAVEELSSSWSEEYETLIYIKNENNLTGTTTISIPGKCLHAFEKWYNEKRSALCDESSQTKKGSDAQMCEKVNVGR